MTTEITLAIGPHDFLGPLARGEVSVPGLRVRLDHATPMDATPDDAARQASEASLSRYLMMRARGDTRYSGLPFFILRGFRHRFFFTTPDSELRSLPDLRGRLVGITAWFDTGNTWTKAMLTDAGVGVGELDWVLGPLDTASPLKPRQPDEPPLPPNVGVLPPGRSLVGELAAGRIDALVAPRPPDELGRPGGVRRLIEDYPAAEADYFRRTGVYPACHIVVLDRRLAADRPGLLLGLHDALAGSWAAWCARAFWYADAAPWVLTALEDGARLLGPDWQQHGLAAPANRQMLQVLADEQVSQGHVGNRTDPLAAFEDYTAALAGRP